MLRSSRKLLAEDGILRRDSDRTHVEVALAKHHAAHRDEGGRREAPLLCAQETGDSDIAPGANLAVGL